MVMPEREYWDEDYWRTMILKPLFGNRKNWEYYKAEGTETLKRRFMARFLVRLNTQMMYNNQD